MAKRKRASANSSKGGQLCLSSDRISAAISKSVKHNKTEDVHKDHAASESEEHRPFIPKSEHKNDLATAVVSTVRKGDRESKIDQLQSLGGETFVAISTSTRQSNAELATEHTATKSAVKALLTKKRVAFVTGASISTSAGLPDFRSKTGALKTAKHLWSATCLTSDQPEFVDYMRALTTSCTEAVPTDFHYMLGKLAAQNKMQALWSTNIDGLEARTPGLTSDLTVLLHGTLHRLVCTVNPSHEFASDSKTQIGDHCTKCLLDVQNRGIKTPWGLRGSGSKGLAQGWLRPRVTLEHEPTYDGEEIGKALAKAAKKVPDALVVAGSSLSNAALWKNVRDLAKRARAKGGMVCWVGHGTCKLRDADFVLDVDCDAFAAEMMVAMDYEARGTWQQTS